MSFHSFVVESFSLGGDDTKAFELIIIITDRLYYVSYSLRVYADNIKVTMKNERKFSKFKKHFDIWPYIFFRVCQKM